MYKILADENIPFAEEAFSKFGSVQLIPGRDITNEILRPYHILIIRSVTKVNEQLLKGTNVKFVGTTTIGLDHIDTVYLQKMHISCANAPGCNADSVAEYIFAGLYKIASEAKFPLEKCSMGIIGYGNIGSRVAGIAAAIGMKLYINDPPLQRQKGDSFFCSYEQAIGADIITYHVPLNIGGTDNTYHMLSSSQLNTFDGSKIILNASRGSVVSNDDLKKFLQKNRNKVILDVWENEPLIDNELLKLVWIGTPHVAGYSFEGKINGTIMIYNLLNRFLNEKRIWKPAMPGITNAEINYPESGSAEESFSNLISEIYNIRGDDQRLREIPDKDKAGRYFDRLRKNYPVRREFSNYRVRINKKLKKEIKILEALRFKLKEY